ncbi:MAG: ExbD/TolR family protein [Planctomycetaceae bacterium]
MKFKSPPMPSAEMDMTPMMDLTFQLISFFMMVTNFDQTQVDERVRLPTDALAKPPEMKVEHELVINIGFKRAKDGSRLDPLPFVFLPGEELRVPEYKQRLMQEARIYQAKAIKLTDVTVVVRADADVPTGQVQEFIKMSQDAKFEKFALRAQQPTD